MIYDTLANIDRYKGDKNLYKALCWARDYKGAASTDDAELDGRKLYAMVRTLMTASRDGRVFESHRKYIDVHVTLSGEEAIDFCLQPLAVDKPYDPAKDAELQKPPAEFGSFIVRPGSFAVFYTGEVHRPSCPVTVPASFRKIVLKIQV